MSSVKVPYTSFKTLTESLKGEILPAIERVLDSGKYILGPEVFEFENDFAAYCQSKQSVSTSSGTQGLMLTLQSLNLKKGDEVITAPNSYIASASTIAMSGGRPVFVDVCQDMNMDPEKLEATITPKTRAIIVVHLTGRPAPMPEIIEIARKNNLFLLEDASQAVGASLNNKKVGSWGDAGVFSLHPLKILFAMGDGGVITTDDDLLSEFLIKARSHGLKNRDTCEFWSDNSRLDTIQAAIINVQLRCLEDTIEKRRKLAFRYNEKLESCVIVPHEGRGERCVYQTYMVQAEKRDELQKYLLQKGISSLVHYSKPIHVQPAAAYLGYSPQDFPVTMELSSSILSLPLFVGMLEEQQDYVIETIQEFYK